jgi:hypothetical protein
LLVYTSIIYYSVCHKYCLWQTRFDVYIGVIFSVDFANLGDVCLAYVSACTAFCVVVLLIFCVSIHSFSWCCCYTYVCSCLVLVVVSASCCYTHVYAVVCHLPLCLYSVVTRTCRCVCPVFATCHVSSLFFRILLVGACFKNLFTRCQACLIREGGDLKRLL